MIESTARPAGCPAQPRTTRARGRVALEDSAPGLASAIAAGTTAIGVPLHVALEEGPGHTIWHTLEGTPESFGRERALYHLTPGYDRATICISASIWPRCSV